MIDTTKIQLPEGSIRQKLMWVFIDHINFCHGEFHNGVDKPVNKVYDWCYEHWLYPFKQTDCLCCNTIRGLLYGGVIGFILGVLV